MCCRKSFHRHHKGVGPLVRSQERRAHRFPRNDRSSNARQPVVNCSTCSLIQLHWGLIYSCIRKNVQDCRFPFSGWKTKGRALGAPLRPAAAPPSLRPAPPRPAPPRLAPPRSAPPASPCPSLPGPVSPRPPRPASPEGWPGLGFDRFK